MAGHVPRPRTRLARNPLAWLLLVALVLGGLALLRSGPRRTPAPAPAGATTAGAKATIPDRDPQPIEQIKPVYPLGSLARRDQGYVAISLEIDAAGVPTNAFVSRPSGHDELDQTALETLRRWRFHPAIRGGKPVASTMQVPILFDPDAPP